MLALALLVRLVAAPRTCVHALMQLRACVLHVPPAGLILQFEIFLENNYGAWAWVPEGHLKLRAGMRVWGARSVQASC